MTINVIFDFAKVFDIDTFEVAIGEKFVLSAQADERSNPTDTSWFSNNDKVLSLEQNGSDANCQATDIGSSIILIMDAGLITLKKIAIKVVQDVSHAQTLNPQPDNAPESK